MIRRSRRCSHLHVCEEEEDEDVHFQKRWDSLRSDKKWVVGLFEAGRRHKAVVDPPSFSLCDKVKLKPHLTHLTDKF